MKFIHCLRQIQNLKSLGVDWRLLLEVEYGFFFFLTITEARLQTASSNNG